MGYGGKPPGKLKDYTCFEAKTHVLNDGIRETSYEKR